MGPHSEFVGGSSAFYLFAPATDDFALVIPRGVFAIMIRLNAQILHVSIGETAVVVNSDGSSRITNSGALGVDDGTQNRFLMFVRSGQVLSISHADGTTAIGSFEVWVFGNPNFFPANAAAWESSDPG
jgi:hypothetical protein